MRQQVIRTTAIVIFFLLTLSVKGFANPWAIDEMIGREASPFSLKDLKGQEVSLMDFRGKVILLNFWATWCPPCISEIPKLNNLRKAYADKNFEIIAVSTDRSLSTIKKFIRKHPVSFVVLHDSSIKVSRKYNVFSIPTTFLIDKKGKIVEKFLGEYDWNSPEIRKKIDELL
ncbi:thiol-disulfide oxidoreductase ResA [bacterium BMS3Bbin07]|nr:thiol-disulfide oxidoreductase ResA [bacterium BMS3Bbin07]